jgi:valyl-tRNA synthetase
MDTELFIPIAEHVDLGAETDRLGREIERIDGELKRLAGKLGNAKFVERAPADVVEKEKAKQAGYEAEKATLMAALERVRAIAGGPGGAS